MKLKCLYLQALIASYLSKGEYKIVKEVADFVLKVFVFFFFVLMCGVVLLRCI